MIGTKFHYPYESDDGRENMRAGSDIFRVQRGGSHIQPAPIIRAAFRTGGSPKARNEWGQYGFRIAVLDSATVDPIRFAQRAD